MAHGNWRPKCLCKGRWDCKSPSGAKCLRPGAARDGSAGPSCRPPSKRRRRATEGGSRVSGAGGSTELLPEFFDQAIELIQRAKLDRQLAHLFHAAVALDAFFHSHLHIGGQQV